MVRCYVILKSNHHEIYYVTGNFCFFPIKCQVLPSELGAGGLNNVDTSIKEVTLVVPWYFLYLAHCFILPLNSMFLAFSTITYGCFMHRYFCLRVCRTQPISALLCPTLLRVSSSTSMSCAVLWPLQWVLVLSTPSSNLTFTHCYYWRFFTHRQISATLYNYILPHT